MLFLLTEQRNPVILKRIYHVETFGVGSTLRAGPAGVRRHQNQKESLEITSLQLVRTCKKLALDKKAEDVLLLDLRGLSSVTDYFVICHGTSRRHVQAVAENVRFGLKNLKVAGEHVEGFAEGRWVVLDYIDAIVHIFDEETRKMYRLEELWGDAARIE